MKRHIRRSLRIILFAAGLLSISLTGAFASVPDGPEGPHGHGDEIRNMKIAFFTDALQLTPEQSENSGPFTTLIGTRGAKWGRNGAKYIKSSARAGQGSNSSKTCWG